MLSAIKHAPSALVPASRTAAYAPYAIFVLAAGILLPFYRWSLSPDNVSYLSIARQYAGGHWWEAVNAYWGVLWSLLLGPWFAAGVPETWSVQVMQGLAGLALLHGAGRVLRVLGVARPLPWMLAAVIMICGMLALRCGTDLLFAAILVHYMAEVFGPPRNPARYGLLGGLLFLAKSYGFYFFLLHFTLMTLWSSWILRGLQWRTWLRGVVVFALISGVWIGIISAKYDRLVIGTNGEENLRKTGPDSLGYFPVKFLRPPPSEHAVSMWQDPPVEAYAKWDRFGSFGALKHQVKTIWANVKEFHRLFLLTSVFWLGIVVAYAIAAGSRARSGHWIPVLGTFFIYPAGYYLVLLQDRYLWAMQMLLLAMAAVVYETVTRKARLGAAARFALLAILLVSFGSRPMLVLAGWFRSGAETEAVAERLSGVLTAGSRFASCGNFGDSLSIAYRLGAKYHGIVKETEEDWEETSFLNRSATRRNFVFKPADEGPIAERLSHQQVRYVLVWPSCAQPPAALAQSRVAAHVDGVRLLEWNAR